MLLDAGFPLFLELGERYHWIDPIYRTGRRVLALGPLVQLWRAVRYGYFKGTTQSFWLSCKPRNFQDLQTISRFAGGDVCYCPGTARLSDVSPPQRCRLGAASTFLSTHFLLRETDLGFWRKEGVCGRVARYGLSSRETSGHVIRALLASSGLIRRYSAGWPPLPRSIFFRSCFCCLRFIAQSTLAGTTWTLAQMHFAISEVYLTVGSAHALATWSWSSSSLRERARARDRARS